MKKIIASAVGIVMVGGIAVTNASAVESIFGGYWRTRFISQSDFEPTESSYNRIDNRTRLYYTAKFNDNFKFVNKFEYDTNWGDDDGGDFGADGKIFEVKNSYADFTLGDVRTKMGMMGGALSRGFIMDTDFSGVIVEPKFGDVSVPLMWARVNGEYVSELESDEDVFSATAKIGLGDDGKIAPFLVYHTGNNKVGDLDAFYVGVDADLNFGDISTWGTFIYQGGTNALDEDNAGYLVALGGSFNMFHGEFFYASGDDDDLDGDNDAFLGTPGRSYYWSEIMGYGTFDNAVSAGSPGDAISNVYALNVGVKLKPAERLTLSIDLWYANLAEDNAFGEDELGTEIDVKLTYKIMDNLNLDLVGAYLAAGDATMNDLGKDSDDPVEVGARFSLSF